MYFRALLGSLIAVTTHEDNSLSVRTLAIKSQDRLEEDYWDLLRIYGTKVAFAAMR